MAVSIQTQLCALFILFMSLLDGGAALCLLNLQQVRRCFCRLSEYLETALQAASRLCCIVDAVSHHWHVYNHNGAVQDPQPCHELGCLFYRAGDYATAKIWLQKAQQQLPRPLTAGMSAKTAVLMLRCTRYFCDARL